MKSLSIGLMGLGLLAVISLGCESDSDNTEDPWDREVRHLNQTENHTYDLLMKVVGWADGLDALSENNPSTVCEDIRFELLLMQMDLSDVLDALEADKEFLMLDSTRAGKNTTLEYVQRKKDLYVSAVVSANRFVDVLGMYGRDNHCWPVVSP